MLGEQAVPRLATGVRFRFDQVRGAWVLLAPERVFQPDEIAVEILKLIDGQRSFGSITDMLTQQFHAPRAVIAADVAKLLLHLSERGALRL